MSWAFKSLPTRERGLKSTESNLSEQPTEVAPYAGAWIEILVRVTTELQYHHVAPYAGAWIEILRG